MSLLIRVGLKAVNPEPWPMLLGTLALAAMLLRQGARIATGPLQLLAAVGVALGMFVLHLSHAGDEAALSSSVWLAIVIAVAVGFPASPGLGRGGDGRRWALRAAARV